MTSRAVIFDFNGTISDDEPVLERLFSAISRDLGRPLTSEEYYRDLAGLSDHAIIERVLELNGMDPSPQHRNALMRVKVDRYKELVSERPTIAEPVAAFVRAVAERVPVAIASGAVREEVEHVLALAGLGGAFTAVVCIDDVQRGKPDPEGFQTALAALNAAADGGEPIAPGEVLVFEDADAGVQAAKAAGMRCAVLRTLAYSGSPVAADLTLEHLDPGLVPELLSPAGTAADRSAAG